MKILTIYDGTIQAKTALRYGMEKVREKGGELVVLHVFQGSLFVDYDAGPMAEEMARAEAGQRYREAEKIISEAGRDVPIRMVSEEGEPGLELLRAAQKEHADIILATPRYRGIVRSAPCPVYVIPGVILVPVDCTGAAGNELEAIAAEAKAAGSRVLLAGIVPVHLYGNEEAAELKEVRVGIEASAAAMSKALVSRGIETSAIIRSGYPDEEILKAAEEFVVSLIMFPAGGKTPSELAKTAAMLLDEPEGPRTPILLLQAGT